MASEEIILSPGQQISGARAIYTVRRHIPPSPHARGLSYEAEVQAEIKSPQSAEEDAWGPALEPGTRVFIKTPRISRLDPFDNKLATIAVYSGDFVIQLTKHRALSQFEQEFSFTVDAGWNISYASQVPVPFLAQTWVEGVTLREYLLSRPKFAGLEPNEWFDLATRISDIVRHMHNYGVVHGDISPDNIMMTGGADNPQPVLVDFGESILFTEDPLRRQTAERGTRHLYQPPERRAGGDTWQYPADIYSLGAVFYFMATGEDPEGLPTDIHDLKRTVLEKVKSRNPDLLTHARGSGAVKIIDKCLRERPYDRYSYMESLSRAITIFGRREGALDVDSIKLGIEETNEFLDTAETGEDNDLFVRLLAVDLARLRRRVASMRNDHVEVVGEREELIDSLLEYLSMLQPGDEYVTVTSPLLWTDDNLGINGRFLTMNRILAQEGVSILRVFSLCESDREDPEVRRILESHVLMDRELESSHVHTTKPDGEPEPGTLYTGYVLTTPDQRARDLTQDNPVAYWRRQGSNRCVSISFSLRPVEVSGPDPGMQRLTIGKVRFRSTEISGLREYESFRELVRESTPLHEFVREEGVTKRRRRRAEP